MNVLWKVTPITPTKHTPFRVMRSQIKPSRVVVVRVVVTTTPDLIGQGIMVDLDFFYFYF